MNKYLLDTNIASYFADDLSPFHSAVSRKISHLGNQKRVYLSMLTIYELQHAISCVESNLAEKFINTIKVMTEIFEITNLSKNGAAIFGKIKTRYRQATGTARKALERHNIDIMLAASAVSENAVLVSNDRIFERIHEIYPELLT